MNEFFDSKNKNIRLVKIFEWVDWAANPDSDDEKNFFFLALPVIQRNSVWNPSQIMELWDSLLQGMPIGSMLAYECEAGTPARRIGSSKPGLEKVPEGGGLELVDGHQRTLAMLTGWPRPEHIANDCCLWVDFADEPLSGQLLRLRLTTKNHPFGFRRDKSTRLALDDKREAYDAFEALRHGMKDADKLENAKEGMPFSHQPSLPMPMSCLINLWRQNPNNWKEKVLKELRYLEGAQKEKDKEGRRKWVTTTIWNSLDKKKQHDVEDRIDTLNKALHNLREMQIPVIRLDEQTLKNKNANEHPPIEILFKRIGTNGEPLSPGDYAYSIIKNRCPETYELVEGLHQYKNVASLLTPTDLVMSAVRLAATEEGKSDPEDPTIRDLSRLLGNDSFVKDRFLPLVKSPEMELYFKTIHEILLFDKNENKLGLPVQALPLLDRPLVQILLRLAHADLLKNKNEVRTEVLRLVMFWLVAARVENTSKKHKASRLAYKLIEETKNKYRENIIKEIYEQIVNGDMAVRLHDPCDVKKFAFPENRVDKLRGESRFEDAPEKQIMYFFRNCWWQPWTHQHPILLWLQREYIFEHFKKYNPMAGRDDNTPYDYDHILPQALYDARSNKFTGISEDEEKDGWRNTVGNSIGNIRIIDLSKNRSDGNATPGEKLKLYECNESTRELLTDFVIDDSQVEDWRIASGKGKSDEWDRKRALAFQSAVENRTFDLYQRYYDELGFKAWERQEESQ